MELTEVKTAIQNYMKERLGFELDRWSWMKNCDDYIVVGLVTNDKGEMVTVRASKSGHFAWYRYEDGMKIDKDGKVVPQ